MTPAVLRTAPDTSAPQRERGSESSGDFAALFGALRQAEPPRLPEPPRNEAPRAAAPAAPEAPVDEAPRAELPAAPEAPDKPLRPRPPRQPAPPGLPQTADSAELALQAEAASPLLPVDLAEALQAPGGAASEAAPPADAALIVATLPAPGMPAASEAVSGEAPGQPAGDQGLDGVLPARALAGRQEALADSAGAAQPADKSADKSAADPAAAGTLALPPTGESLPKAQRASQEPMAPRGPDALAALPGSQAFGPAAATTPNTASAQAALALPPQHPGFADELGAQLSVWTRQGVQQAELRLNPAELGPVQVRIQIEGQQAQVRFVADAAPTRDALEAALPQLAEALQREGLQLAGGSVQSQAQQQQQQQREQAAAALTPGRRQAAAPVAPAPVATPRPASQRLLDLYA